jgi:hypothetical protein
LHGGSAYGAGCIAGQGPTKPSQLELELAETQGMLRIFHLVECLLFKKLRLFFQFKGWILERLSAEVKHARKTTGSSYFILII